MSFKGRVSTREIEQNPVDIEADQSDAWMQETLAEAAPSSDLTDLAPEEWAKKCNISAQLRLEMAGPDYVVKGHFDASVPSPCSRCGDLFQAQRQADFNVVMHRIMKDEDAEIEDDSGDADYVFLKKDEVDLRQIVSEQLIVLEPVAECPARKADGSCALCGKNPQFAGQVQEIRADSPFAKLGALKLGDKKSGKKD
ncbi:MAG: DUF177 domain-containing protein [Bdellovibrionales bacterium]|nr:DUF177 domain-containing protein [Bdellovibrionales bacterium]